MSTKLGRGTASTRVATSVQRFSDALLIEEQKFFGEVTKAFRAGQTKGLGSLESALRRSKGVDGLKNDGKLLPQLADSVGVATSAARPGAESLAATGATLAIQSIADELKLVERTVAAKYEGVSDAGVAAVQLGDLQDQALGLYDEAMAKVAARFAEQARFQLDLSRSRAETGAELTARLYSLEPLKMHGNGGKGVFWQAADYVNSAGRSMVISLANAVRESAMRATNEAYARIHG